MDKKLNNIEKFILKKISDIDDFPSGAFNIRENGSGIKRHTTENVNIVSKTDNKAIGTIEVFNRKADDYFNNCGLLRLDLRSDYEQEESIFEILSLIVPSVFELFNCQIIATKVPHFASERKLAIIRLGFVASEEKLIGGHDKKIYTEYYVLQK